MTRRLPLVAALVLIPLVIAGCTKPNPGASVFAGTTSQWREAVCWAFDTPALEPGQCAQDIVTAAAADDTVATIPVVPGETIGISVDPVVADTGWYVLIGQTRVNTTPITDTYFRFAFPDLQELPPEGALLQVVAGDEQTRGLWVYKLIPA